jgi:hypothetical protein
LNTVSNKWRDVGINEVVLTINLNKNVVVEFKYCNKKYGEVF